MTACQRERGERDREDESEGAVGGKQKKRSRREEGGG